MDTALTITINIWSAFVFSILLKEKAAPETKKIPSQNSKVFNTGMLANTNDSILPVIMHFETDTPNR